MIRMSKPFSRLWYREYVIPSLGADDVMLGTSALCEHGLTVSEYPVPIVGRITPNRERVIPLIAAIYNIPTSVDKIFCTPYHGVWLPSPERAIVESLLYDNLYNELGEFYDCLSCYKSSPQFSEQKLREVCDHFSFPYSRVLEELDECDRI